MTTATVRSLDREEDGRLTVLASCSLCHALARYDVGIDLDALDLSPVSLACGCDDFAELEDRGGRVVRLRSRVIRRQEEEDEAHRAALAAQRAQAAAEAQTMRARAALGNRLGAERALCLAAVLADVAASAGGRWTGSTADLLALVKARPEMAADHLTSTAALTNRLRGHLLGLALEAHGLAVTSARTPTGLRWTIARR
jgi:hypothetical protein